MGCANEALGPLPDGYAIAPLFAGGDPAREGPLRLCIVLRRDADPVAGHWVLLRDLFDARIVLGALADAAGTIHEYVEIWIQTLETVHARKETLVGLTNAALDQRWHERFDAFHKADAASVIATGWEAEHPAPILIDISNLRPASLPGAQGPGDGWQLCRDDQVLRQAGLPDFSGSLDRYLYQPALGKEGPFVALVEGSPTNAATLSLQDLLGQTDAAPLNPGGGLLLVRPYQPLGFDEFLDVLREGAWSGVRHGRAVLHWPGPAEASNRNADEGATEPLAGRRMLVRPSRVAQALERFYLTLCALEGTLLSMRDVVRQTQRPVLNLSPASLRVGLGDAGPGVPLLWTARVRLADPGDAIPLAIEGTDARYFLGSGGMPTIYQPGTQSAGIGRGSFRIRQLLQDKQGVVVEGTFTPRERIDGARNDLLRLRIGLAAGRLDLHTRLQPDMALASGEWRLRSLPQSMPPPLAAQLQAAEGVPLPNVEFEHIPFRSTPCDLYALAVLALRSLVLRPGGGSGGGAGGGGGGGTLAVAVDEMISLARQAGLEAGAEAAPLAERIAALFRADPRWAQALGPHAFAIGNEQGAPAATVATTEPGRWLVPASLWYQTLAAIVRLLPGLGADSLCVDYGDAPPGALHRVFERALPDWDALVLKTRGLLLGDWQLDREMNGIIGWFLDVPANANAGNPGNAANPVNPANATPAKHTSTTVARPGGNFSSTRVTR